MRSGTSFFDWTVFKKTICRFWPLWAVYTVIWLIPLPLNGLMMLRLDSSNRAASMFYGGYMKNFAWNTVPDAASQGFGLAMAVIFGVLCAMAVFSHLYNARSANLFGSLPVRREGLFLTHYLAGLCFLIVPNMVIFLLTLAVEAAGGCVVMDGLLFWLAVTCGESFLFYSMAVFCAMFTGHILALPAFYAIFNCIFTGITALVEGVLSLFYYGFAGFPTGVGRVMRWLTPVWRLEGVSSYWSWLQDDMTDSILTDGPRVLVMEGLDIVAIYAVAALALTVGAFFLYRARRLESAGDVVSVKAMRPVFRYGVALCAGLLFGMGTMFFTGGGEITLMIAIVVWGVIGCFAAQMLLDKSFKVFKKWKGAAVVAGVFLALFLVVSLDLTGFETRIPDPSDVDSVYVSGLGAVYMDDSGDRISLDISDPDTIALLNVLHRAAVDQRDADISYGGGIRSVGLSLDYTLKNGSTLSRSYSLWLDSKEVNQEGTASWAVQQIYNDRDLFWQVYGFDQLENYLAQGMRLGEVSCYFYDNEEYGYNSVGFSGQDGQRLLAAVKEDFFAGRIGVRNVADEDSWYYGPRERNSLAFHAVDSEGNSKGYVQIAVQDTAASTRAALNDMADRAGVNETGYYDGYYK